MNTAYKSILRIDLKHSYYAEGQNNELSLTPTSETHQHLINTDCKLVQKGNAAELFAPESFNLTDYSIANAEVHLMFILKSANLNFLNFTNLPLDTGQKWIFTNETTDGVNVLVSSDVADEFGQNQLLVIDLALADLAAAAGNEPLQLSLMLEKRSIGCRYYIINQSPISGILALSGKGSELFSGPEEVSLQNDIVAQMFTTSPNFFPIGVVPDIALTLELTANEDHSAIKTPLPLPNTENLNIAMVDGRKEYYMPVYIYL